MDRRLCWALAVFAALLIYIAIRLARYRLLDGVKTKVMLHGGARLHKAAVLRMLRGRW